MSGMAGQRLGITICERIRYSKIISNCISNLGLVGSFGFINK